MLSYTEEIKAQRLASEAISENSKYNRLFGLVEQLANTQEMKELVDYADAVDFLEVYDMDRLNAYSKLLDKAEADNTIEWTEEDDNNLEIEQRARTYAKDSLKGLVYALGKVQDAYNALQDALDSLC